MAKKQEVVDTWGRLAERVNALEGSPLADGGSMPEPEPEPAPEPELDGESMPPELDDVD